MNIHELVEKYKDSREAYLKSTYNETQLRNDFIDPFLKCLGWDVDNEGGKSQSFRDVIQEEYIEIEDENSKKSPDYTLRINGSRMLFIEAKKPSINISNSTKAAFQTRRYGWSAQLSISILTNFEHLIIYDCRLKPNDDDNEHVSRYKVFSYEDYEENIVEIKSLISYDSINSGNLDELFNTNTRKGETFDEYFLQQIESWREKLAKTAIESNDNLDEEDVNYIIQRLLNRVIFLRICEDRTIEKSETIRSIKNYDELKILFHKADKKFNSGLFNFIDDMLSLEIIIDAGILIDIFDELYFPQSPYDFSVVDPAILSQIYERFLGRKITIGDNQTYAIRETPEISASNGVVPTPKIIAEQIIKDTLLPLIKNKTYSELNEIKIADICCGSGTFLISAFDFLLEKKLERIIEEKISDTDLIHWVGDGLCFTLKGKRDILKNNLHGVDINPYAVEVTEFSLLLKLLEGENDATINNFIELYSNKILPNLKTNLKCGNSLVDGGFYAFYPNSLEDDSLLFKVKPFDWDKEFAEIMENGGFDAIVGNPPYVRIQNMKKYSSEEIEYYQSSDSPYTVAKKAAIDKYFVFIQRALNLIKPTGLLGYIVPHKFFLTTGGKLLRKFITEGYQINKIIHFGVTQVFPERSTYTAILILQTNKKDEFDFKRVSKISAKTLSSNEDTQKYKTQKFNSNPWVFLSPETDAIFCKFMDDKYEGLGKLTDISVGLQTSADDIYVFIPEDESDDVFTFMHNEIKYQIEKSICQPAIYDLSFKNFESIIENSQIIFPYTIKDGKALLITEDLFEQQYPLAWEYLSKHKNILKKRNLQGKNPKWYQYGRSQSLAKFHNTEKLIWPVLSTQAPYVLDMKNLLFTGGGNGPYYGLLNRSGYSLLYFLGILSHPIIESMVKAGASEFRGEYYSHGKQFIENLPIRKIDFTVKEEKKTYELILNVVQNLINATTKSKTEKNNARKIILDRKRDTLLNQLISIINELYQISDEEFATVMSDEMLVIARGEDE